MPPRNVEEDGVSQDIERIGNEFADQRSRLADERERFAQWQEDWRQRQQSIDASLEFLKERFAWQSQVENAGHLRLMITD